MTINLSRDASYDNLYQVFYNITSNGLVNYIKTNLTIKDTSLLFPETYFDEDINTPFTATTFHSGSAGMVIIPSEVDKV